MIEYSTPILGTSIDKLSPGICRINVPPEGIEYLFISCFGWIVENLDCFDMPGLTRGYLFIGGILLMPSGVA